MAKEVFQILQTAREIVNEHSPSSKPFNDIDLTKELPVTEGVEFLHRRSTTHGSDNYRIVAIPGVIQTDEGIKKLFGVNLLLPNINPPILLDNVFSVIYNPQITSYYVLTQTSQEFFNCLVIPMNKITGLKPLYQ